MKNRYDLLEGVNSKYALFGLLFAFGNRLQAAGDAFYEEITCKQFFFLICLTLFHGEAPTINELSDVMGCSHQNAKQIALKLEKIGLIRMETDAEDRRKLRVIETPLMEEMGRKYANREVEFLQHFYEGISDRDVDTAYQVMSSLEKNLMKIKEQIV